MSFFEFLTLIFIVLKLVGVISWSWLLVISPYLIGIVLGGLLILFREYD